MARRVYLWELTQCIEGRFASWGPNQPDNAFDQDEDCLRTKGPLWYDTPCLPELSGDPAFTGLGYVCEAP
ncbi:MAG TPA: hypothetical protein VHO25_05335 [Polyangiaceae bacterium]|nr:hypothetical protein [Polyangiaceae bacterium]